MTTNNKILTVSYGTFSCTLEGFEDNFGTMKAIAEYFRDLAADDRYFGAEPPQPDTEMLARIAEREILRRVEAREHEGRIVLSASETQAADAQPTAVPLATAAPLAAAAAVAATAAKDEPADLIQDNIVDDGEVTADEQTDDTVEEVTAAETLDADVPTDVDIEDTAEDAADEAEADQETTDDLVMAAVEDAATETDEDIQSDVPSVSSEEDITEAGAEAEAEAEADSEVDAFFAASDADESDVDIEEDVAVAETVEADVAPAADSIAAKLQRIRAVVSQSQQDVEDDELFEDEHADEVLAERDTLILSDDDEGEDEVAESDDVVAQTARDIEEAFEIDDAAADTDETDAQEDDALDALMARLDTDAAADNAPELAEDIAATETVADTDSNDDMGLDTLAALMAADKDPDSENADGENLFDTADSEDFTAESIDLDAMTDDVEDAIETDADEFSSSEDDVATPRRARVIKVKRADIDAALASGQLEQVDEEAEVDSSLSEDEEAELLAELAKVEADFPADQSEDDANAMIEADADDEVAEAIEDDAEIENVAASKSLDVQDDDVSRLMAEAENQMEEPEGSDRRDAFAHLKAAVKAKKADAKIGDDSLKDEGAFRSDLAEVVKPRRPEVKETHDERPETPRPAPLKLVAEQRVDMDSAHKGPVRPRRVEASQEAVENASDAETFADYAAELGAHDLPALLEAAASYLSFVEGRDQFSRPQLMNKVRQIELDDFSREDGLRSFGQLLRSGKIEKIKGGRFAVTGDIGYRPEQRAAS